MSSCASLLWTARSDPHAVVVWGRGLNIPRLARILTREELAVNLVDEVATADKFVDVLGNLRGR